MEKLDKKLVVKSNSLIESKYKLTTRQQKIVLFLISQLKKEDEDFKTYTLPIKKFADMMELKGNPKYKEIKEITEGLQQKLIRVKEGRDYVTVAWLSYTRYNKNEGTIDLRFDPFLKPYLLNLKREFTSYDLQNILMLSKTHSIRLFELLKQYETIKERTFKIDELKSLLGIEDFYPRYSNFKQKVLVEAQKELKQHTDIYFEIEEIKKGRSVEKIRFIIHKQPKHFLNNAKYSDELHDLDSTVFAEINRITQKYGFSVSEKEFHVINDLAQSKYVESYETEIYKLFEKVSSDPSISKPIPYIKKILKSDGNGSIKTIREEKLPNWLIKQKRNESELTNGNDEIDHGNKDKFEELKKKFQSV